MHVHTRTHTQTHTHIRMHTNTRTCAHIHAQTTHTNICTQTHTRTHIYIHTNTHASTHTHTYTHTNTHTFYLHSQLATYNVEYVVNGCICYIHRHLAVLISVCCPLMAVCMAGLLVLSPPPTLSQYTNWTFLLLIGPLLLFPN